MADWFKRLKHLFEPEEANREAGQLESKADNSSMKKVTARVSYQYPNGQFRFPVIPDEMEEPQAPRKRRGSEQQKPPRNEGDRVKRKVQPAESDKKPFRLTDIPSPVYGFHKRQDQMTEQPMKNKYDIEYTYMQEKRNLETEEPSVYEQETTNVGPNTSSEHGDLEYEPETPAYEPEVAISKLEFAPSYPSEETNFMEEDISDEVSKSAILEEEDVNDQNVGEQEGASSNPEEVSMLDRLLEQFPDEEPGGGSITEAETVERNDEPDNSTSTKRGFREDTALSGGKEEPEQSFSDEVEAGNTRQGTESGHSVATTAKQEEITEGPIPYNVVMLKRDREKTQSTRKSEDHGYRFPSIQMLDIPKREGDDDRDWLEQQSHLLDETLENFNVRARVVGVTKGPAVTRFEVQPEPGVKVNKITNLTDDIKLSLAAKDIRIEAPIPGTNRIGIEVPNKKSTAVYLREILRSPAFGQNPSPLTAALGLDIAGNPIVTDLSKMPHGLIAGATGSGKSVCINSILVSLLYKASPHEVKLMLVDPKMVELAPYNGIPHLVSPVINDVKAATAALKWAVEEMERRYEALAHAGVRDIKRYNEYVKKNQLNGHEMPFLVIIIDELADLMMVSPQDVEDAICRIAQKARACGIHLILATQRPSVDVITGLIKANIPTRIAFSVSSQVDSRTIIDSNGAEKLLGKGDMLFVENGASKAARLQGTFVTDEEIDRVTDFARSQMKPAYLFEPDALLNKMNIDEEEDDLFYEACQFVAEQGGASSSSLQRRFRIGFNRAARLIDMMEAQGMISEPKGSKPRDVLITKEQIENMLENDSSPF